MGRFIGSLILGAALLAPMAINAEEHHSKRYYDRDRRDWHEWNEAENRAYHRYWEERREAHRDWARLKRRQQIEYWRWRHQHPNY